jgi:uncharacterized protein YndB with AHSA1/START domain
MAADAERVEPLQLVVSRRFSAPREAVFMAWSSAEQLRQWFCPAGYSVPEAMVEFRIGGAFDICMRSPQGVNHWTRGRYTVIRPHSHLEIDMNAVADNGTALFRALTVAKFADDGGATRLEVTQTYTVFEAFALPMIQGASQGWNQTLDRLERVLPSDPRVRA